MSTTSFWLTNNDSDIAGYKLAKLGDRSDNPTLTQVLTNTVTSPTTQPVLTNRNIVYANLDKTTQPPTGSVLQWITEPLKGGVLSAAAWIYHVWASESNAAANTGLQLQVYQFTNAVGSLIITDTGGPELPTSIQDYNRTTGNATLTTLNDGDRLVFVISLNSVGGSVSAYSVQFDYNAQYPYADGDSYIIAPDIISILANVPTDTINRVRINLRDEVDTGNPLATDAEIIQSIDEALKEFSTDIPRLVASSFTGDGASFDYPLPNLWIRDYSTLFEVEYPSGNQVRTLLNSKDTEILCNIVNNQPVWSLHFITMTPDAAQTCVIRYRTQHRHDTVLSTIQQVDLPAFCHLAASYAAIKIAARFATTSDSTLASDVVNYRDGIDRLKRIAVLNRDRYEAHVGIGKNVPATGYQFDWDSNFSWNQDRLIHRRRLR